MKEMTFGGHTVKAFNKNGRTVVEVDGQEHTLRGSDTFTFSSFDRVDQHSAMLYTTKYHVLITNTGGSIYIAKRKDNRRIDTVFVEEG